MTIINYFPHWVGFQAAEYERSYFDSKIRKDITEPIGWRFYFIFWCFDFVQWR